MIAPQDAFPENFRTLKKRLRALINYPIYGMNCQQKRINF